MRAGVVNGYWSSSPYLCRLCGLKMVFTAWRSYATLRLIPVVRRRLEFPPSIQETRRGGSMPPAKHGLCFLRSRAVPGNLGPNHPYLLGAAMDIDCFAAGVAKAAINGGGDGVRDGIHVQNILWWHLGRNRQ